jgi:hypothetical protein
MMHRFNGLMIGVVLLCVFWVIPAHATIDWEEGFEYAAASNLWAVWDESCQGNPTLSTTRVYSGSKSLKEVFTGVAGKDPGAGGCFMGRNLSVPSETLYARYYMYMENFTVNSTQTKMTYWGQNGKYPSFWWGMNFGTPTLGVNVQGIILDNGTRGTVNVYGAPIPQNQWVCIETRITMSSPGVDNGIIQAWINGNQVINKTNQRMRAATLNQQNDPNAQFRFISLYVQHGVGTIYYDNYAVSRDTKIGCSVSSTPSSDSTPPVPPSGVLAR